MSETTTKCPHCGADLKDWLPQGEVLYNWDVFVVDTREAIRSAYRTEEVQLPYDVEAEADCPHCEKPINVAWWMGEQGAYGAQVEAG